MKKLLIFAVLAFTSCSYHVVDNSNSLLLGIPFIQGDKDGSFSKILTQEIASSGLAEFRSRDTRYELHITMNPDALERIGFRYDRFADGTLRPNIVGTETRKTVNISVELYDTLFEKVIYGPKNFQAHTDFDYVDPDNIIEMSFVAPDGQRELAFNYSLGQLNTIEGAQDTANLSVYRILSKKIADELALHFKEL